MERSKKSFKEDADLGLLLDADVDGLLLQGHTHQVFRLLRGRRAAQQEGEEVRR